MQLKGLEVDCMIGGRAQRVTVDATLTTRPDLISQGRLAGEVRFLLQSCDFSGLAAAADALTRFLLAPPLPEQRASAIEAVTLRLTLPGTDQTRTLTRTAAEFEPCFEEHPEMRVDIVFDGDGCGIYRLRVKPGCAIPTHLHRVMRERELILGTGLLLQGRPVPPGLAFSWPHDVPHRYDNPTSSEQTVLCVDRPRFIADDEVQQPTPVSELVLPEGQVYFLPEEA